MILNVQGEVFRFITFDDNVAKMTEKKIERERGNNYNDLDGE